MKSNLLIELSKIWKCGIICLHRSCNIHKRMDVKYILYCILYMRKTRKNNQKSDNNCRLVRGKKETCCINPKRGYWCWSKNTSGKKSRKMKKQCCSKKT